MNDIIDIAKAFLNDEISREVKKATPQLIKEYENAKNPVTKAGLRKYIINRISSSPSLSTNCRGNIHTAWLVWHDFENSQSSYDKWNAESIIIEYYIDIFKNLE